MIVFQKIRFKNFLSYGDNWTEINLNGSKDTLIIGENGAGKSTFLDALSYALYMKPFRQINNPQLVNSINKKHLAVEVEFDIGPNQYRVCRGHGPRYFEVYQNNVLLNQDAHTKDYQKILEQNILKMNYKSFTQIVVLGSRNFTPFMQLSSQDRRSVIEDLLDIQIFSTMANILKDKISENKNDLMNTDHACSVLEEKIAVQQEYIAKVKEDHTKKKEKIQKDIQEKQEEIKTLQTRSESLLRQANTLEQQIVDKDKQKAKSNQLLFLETQIEQKIKNMRSKLGFFEDNNDCPTCGQELDETFKQTKIKDISDNLATTENGMAALESQIVAIGETLASYNVLQQEIDEIKTNAAVCDNKIAGIHSYVESLASLVEEYDREHVNKKHEKDVLRKYEESLETEQLKKNSLRRKQQVLNMAQTLLKDSGIKSRIIKQYVPVMNKLINKYLAAMEFFVDFHLNEDFKETIRSRHRDDFAYNSFSEGEKMRIDLALLFTWRAIAKLKNSASTNLLIMDEIFDSSLDSSGTEEFLKIIKELTSDTNIIIISHKTDQLLDKFSNVIKFEKHKNFSRIAE